MSAGGASITDTTIRWPGWVELYRVLTLQEYNTRVVVLGTLLLGVAAGLIGTFMLLRKRALMGDSLSHATLPGIGTAFILMTWLGGSGKWLPGLLIGAAVFGSIGVVCVLLIRGLTRLKEDAALGIVLSVFFGLGVAILGIIQKMDTGSAAGLESFIYGKTASMLRSDALVIGGAAALITLASLLLFKEFALLCFDQDFAGTQGWPVSGLDVLMMGLVVIVTVIGLQAVGLILMVALLVIPPAAARFWTNHLPTMLIASALIGGISGFIGASVSALLPRLPAGAIIVIVASAVFAFSLFFGTARGLVKSTVDRFRVSTKVTRQHLLRALFEWGEPAMAGRDSPLSSAAGMGLDALMRKRSWSVRRLRGGLRRAARDGLIRKTPEGNVVLTALGLAEAKRVVRNHRLWELFLIHYADIAPSHADRGADELEHVLTPDVLERLEGLLADRQQISIPPSPHLLMN